jgi:IS5 family transposase
LRVDTTLVEADIRSPTDSGLCAHAVSRLTRLGRRIQQAGLARTASLRDRRRSVGKRVRKISHERGRGARFRGPIERLTGEIASRARQTVREARALLRAARRELARGRGQAGLVDRLEQEIAAAEQVLAQTELRLAGQTVIPNRRVSLVDPDARPIRMGNPRRPTEFGYKARVADTAEGFVIADVPQRSNPNDDVLLDGAIAKAKQARIQVRSVYADRGFGTSNGDAALNRHRIRDPIIPRRGRASPREQTRTWKRRYHFRNGLEGRISQLKRKGLRRTRLRSLDGAQIWVGGITLAHNLQRMALLT